MSTQTDNDALLLAVGGDDRNQWLPVFHEHYPDQKVIWYGDGSVSDTELAEVTWVVVWAPNETLYKRIPNVNAIFSLGAGVDHILGSGVEPPNVPIVRYVGGDLTSRMSEWVVLQCLLHLRQHRAYEAQKGKRVWRSLEQPGADEIRVGIMGLGVLGQDAARKLKAIGFQVSGWSRTPKAIEGIRTLAGTGEFDAFLASTDILVSLLPHTPDTEGLVNRQILARLARDGKLGGPVYINGGRGKTQKDSDVLAALRDGTLIGASLDVFEIEPLPKNSLFWDMPNLFVTPHSAAWSKRSDVVHYVMRQIERQRTGKPFENIVNQARGY